MQFSTKSIHIGNEPNLKEGGSGDVIIPIHLSTTFARSRVSIPTAGYEYSRSGNPTRFALEKNLAVLENGKYAYAYSSGLAAITNILFLLKPGDHIIAIDDVYGGTRRLFTQVFANFGLEFSFVNFVNDRDLERFVRPNTKLIWIETPTNPLLKIIDIKAVSLFAKGLMIKTVVDNTFASPYFQNPLSLGADIVVHSMTKYIGGHSNSIAGCLITSDEKIAERLKFLQNAVGAILSPFDSFMILNGIKTLSVRMEKHEENAQKAVEFLREHKKVKRIYYPGLDTHTGYEIAKRQMRGFGGILSFELNSNYNTTIKFLESLKLISIAESLGVVESLIEHPASMTHASVPKSERKKIGLSDTLIRLSIGIEDADDLINDLSQALDKNIV